MAGMRVGERCGWSGTGKGLALYTGCDRALANQCQTAWLPLALTPRPRPRPPHPPVNPATRHPSPLHPSDAASTRRHSPAEPPSHPPAKKCL